MMNINPTSVVRFLKSNSYSKPNKKFQLSIDQLTQMDLNDSSMEWMIACTDALV